MDEMAFKVLVLEDDDDLRETFEEVLTEQGYEVVAVGRAEQAVAAAAREGFDLIVSDIRMEGMDGLEAIEKAQLQQPEIGSLVVSGWASEAETLRAIQLNVGAYLRKPFTMGDFLQQVRTLLQKRHQRQLFRATLAWALEAVGRTGDPSGAARASLAVRLAESRGLPAEVRELLKLAALVQPLQHLPAARLPSFAPQEPLLLAPLLQLMGDRSTLPGRILGVVLGEEGADPALTEAAREIPAEETPALEVLQGLADPERVERSLLALARTLEPAHAARAYREILDRRQPSAAAVEAALGLAALSPEFEEWARRAPQIAAELGPGAAARASLQAGLLLGDRGLLERAHAELTRLGMTELAAQATLVLGREDRLAAARLLLRPDQAGELAASFSRLVPHLVALREPELTERLALDYAGPLARWLAKADRAHREALLDGLQGQGAAPDLHALLLSDPDADLRQRAQRLPTRSAEPLLRLQSMGFFQAFRGGTAIPEGAYKTQKVKYLLAFLAAQGGRFVSEDQVIDEFWPDTPGRGKRNLYATTSELRRSLRTPEYIVRDRDQLGLSPTLPRWHDLDELEAAYQRGDHARIAALASGPYLDGCYAEWAVRRRTDWEGRVVDSLCALALASADGRRYQEALEHAARALILDPLRQQAHLVKMRGHLGLGQPEAAIRQFEACEKLLQREYAGEPTIELLTVYQRARHGLGDA